MTNVVKRAFNLSTLGLFSSPKVEGPSEAELAGQQQAKADEQRRESELKSEGPSRKAGRSRKVGRQLLAFLPGMVGKKGTLG